MKNILTFMILAFFVASVDPTILAAGQPDEKFHKECLYPTAMIISQCGPSNAVGTGVVVKSKKEGDKFTNHVLTVAHVLVPSMVIVNQDQQQFVIEASHKIRIGKYKDWSKYEGYDEFTAEIVFFNQAEDIAMLRFQSDSEMPVATIYKDPEIYIGNDVVRIGCGVGEPFRTDWGKVNSLKESQDKVIHAMRGTIRITANTLPGDSGGPVFYEYKIIGVAQAIRQVEGKVQNNPVFHMAYVIPIEKFLAHEEITNILEDKVSTEAVSPEVEKAEDAVE